MGQLRIESSPDISLPPCILQGLLSSAKSLQPLSRKLYRFKLKVIPFFMFFCAAALLVFLEGRYHPDTS
jgi:hypothetical protein